MQVDWTAIGENAETNDLFNVNLSQLFPKETTYTQFNQCITQASGMTDVTNKQGNKVWFHHSQDILLPIIETKNEIITKYFTLGIGKGDTSFTKQQLHNQLQEVNDSIALAKDNCSA